MRLLHTSDWHLGRGLHGTPLHEAQESALDELVSIARERDVDAVLIAGDVYDRAVPPLEAVGLLHRTLARLTQIAPVILTPGNHDSATRLGFGSGLFTDRLHIRHLVEDVATPVVLTIGDEKVAIYPFPYLDPDDARRRLVADDEEPLERSHAAVLGRAMDLVRADLQQRPEYRSVVVAHAFVVGSSGRDAAEVSDSERDISVGTVDSAPADVFMGVDYVALGHLHGRQRPKAPSDGPVLHYSGSLLRYSLSEANHTKSATLVDITSDGAVALEYVDISQPRQMARISGRFADLIDPDGQHSAHREDWVQITVTDPSRPPDMVATLRGAFPHSLVLRHEPEGQVDGGVSAGTNVAAMTPREVVAEFVSDMGGVDMTDAEAAALEPVLTTVFGEGR